MLAAALLPTLAPRILLLLTGLVLAAALLLTGLLLAALLVLLPALVLLISHQDYSLRGEFRSRTTDSGSRSSKTLT
jgi:hypothetical protein